MFHLTIQLPHEERQVDIPAGRVQRRLTEILRGMELPLNTRCGQRGLCDGCLLELRQGQLQWAATGTVIEAEEPAQSLRGCEVSLPESGCAVVHLPSRSLLAHQPQVVTSFRLNVPRAHDPLWQSLRIAPGGTRGGRFAPRRTPHRGRRTVGRQPASGSGCGFGFWIVLRVRTGRTIWRSSTGAITAS